MVSFSCQNCNDTVKKPKLQIHMNRCHAPVDCIDCSTTFDAQSAKWVAIAQQGNAHNATDHTQAVLQRNKSIRRIYIRNQTR